MPTITGGNNTGLYDASAVNIAIENNINTGNIYATGNLTVDGNITGYSNLTITSNAAVGSIFTDNYYYANGQPLDLSSTYGNANVAAFLPTYSGNIGDGNGYVFGNGSQLTGLPATYDDANVTALMAAFGSNTIATTGNVATGNLAATGTISATGNLLGNNAVITHTLTIGTASQPATLNISDIGSVRFYDNNNDAYVGIRGPSDHEVSYNIILPSAQGAANTVMVNAGNGLTTWQTLYGNANVAAYLPTYTGNLAGGNAVFTGDVTANSFVGDGSQLTGLPAGYTDSDAANLLAAFGSNTISTTGNVDTGNLAVTGVAAISGNINITGNVQGATDYPNTLTAISTGRITVGDSSVNDATNFASLYNALLNSGYSANVQGATYPTGLYSGVASVDYGSQNGNTVGSFNRTRLQNFVGYIDGNGANLWRFNNSAFNVFVRHPIISFNNLTLGYKQENQFGTGNIVMPTMTGTVVRLSTVAGDGLAVTANTVVGSATIINTGVDQGNSATGVATINNAIGYVAAGGMPSNAAPINNYYGYSMFKTAPEGSGFSTFGADTPLNSYYFLYNDDERANSYTAGDFAVGGNVATGNIDVANLSELGNLRISNLNITADTPYINSYSGGSRVDPSPTTIVLGSGDNGNTTITSSTPGFVWSANPRVAIWEKILPEDTYNASWCAQTNQLELDLAGQTLTSGRIQSMFNLDALSGIANGTHYNGQFFNLSSSRQTFTVGVSGNAAANAKITSSAGINSGVFVYNDSRSNTAIGVASQIFDQAGSGQQGIGNVIAYGTRLRGFGTLSPDRVIAYYHNDSVGEFETGSVGLVTSNNFRAANEYYFLYNSDDVAQVKLGSVKSYHTYNYVDGSTTGNITIDKTNGQVQTIALTGNITVDGFANFVTVANDSVNDDYQMDVVRVVFEQGATPYDVTLPTGNAEIKYANNFSTWGNTANATQVLTVEAYGTSGGTRYLVTVGPEFE
jgi:hypothetical protein